MATEIQLKRSYTSGQIPGAANVLVGEPVLNLVDRVLYTKDNSGNIIVISSGNASTIASLAFNAANVAAAFTVAGVSGNVSNIQLASGITSSGLLTTANISELSNLYFTNARARESITIASSNVSGKGSYDSATGVISINAANVSVSSTAPTNPYVGDLWIHADTAVEYLFFGDGDSFQWVEIGEPGTGGSGAASTVAGVTGNVSNIQLASGITQTGILTTANVTEVSNLYFSNARVYSNVNQLGYITSSSLSGYATNSQLGTYATNAQLDSYVTKSTGSWTVTSGTNTYSITVPVNGTYQIWVRGNIPNGIIAYNATATVTNGNVPVVGQQFAWVYNGGGSPLDFTSIPNQFTGTSNTIVRSGVGGSSNTNRFDFGINNSSGSSQTVYWGYVTL
jgi:hypothetical protein